MKKAALHNLGCKVNSYETEAMQQLLEDAGYEIVPFKEGADVYVINTCSVTNIADRKSRQMLHRAKKMNPDAVVVAVGCYVQAAKEELIKDKAVDLVVGNNKKTDLVQILEDYYNQKGILHLDTVIDIGAAREYENLSVSRIADHTRAFIKVQDGCNQFCSYCIIPYTRGRVRSRKPQEVVKEVERLADCGFREIVLTGIHLSSYGVDFEDEACTLLNLITRIHKVDGIKRIRLGSLEPRIITEEFTKELAAMHKLCPHFHLSLQSGCDSTLKRMNRRYTTGEYQRSCELLRAAFQDPAITTDVIVGFPGETEEEFKMTGAFLEQIGFYELHVFKYSRRANTKAESMPGQVEEPVKAERSETFIKLGNKMSLEFRKRCIGKRTQVLMEEKVTVDGRDFLAGYTGEYVKAAIAYDETKKGCFVNGILTGFLNDEVLLLQEDQNI